MDDQLTTTLARDAFNTLCGDKLGDGQNRKVFVCAANPGYVVKVETKATHFQNHMEFNFWKCAEDLPHIARWLAPVMSISANGIILIMRRTEPVRTSELPKRLPWWLADLKQHNFGMLKG